MTLIAHPPSVIHWCARTSSHGDCGIAAIAHACGLTYEQALAATLPVAPKALVDGLYNHEVKRILASLGFSSRCLRKFDLDDESGILAVCQPHNEDSGHYVYLWEGRIIEPHAKRQQLWLNPADYLAHYKYLATHLITLGRKGR